jgi:hypothetical protein
MKKGLLFWSLLFILSPVFNLKAQELIKNSLITGVCYAGNKVKRIYIPPPDEFYRKAGTKGIAKINVYFSGFPANAVKPVEYAVSILETLLPPNTNVTILATWTNITTSGVLANSTTTGYAGGWVIDALQPYAFYPVALAEKIFGKGLNSDLTPDIELNINSSINWYTGIDGDPLNQHETQYDLVTIVIHELIHGLGFFDSMNVGTSTGSYGAGSIPVIYDTFVENISGRRLTDTLVFPNPSVELKNEMTSGNIFFNGPLLNKFTQGGSAKLYAPSTFNSGSSISHLDEDTYPKDNGLMTPFIDKGEAIHDPGKLTMSILGDLGWINTRIVHEPPKDTEQNLSQITIAATIKSDTTYNHNSVGIVWSFDQFATSSTTYLVSPQSNDSYTTTLAIPRYDSELQYYLFVEDVFHRIYRLPSFINMFRYSVYIGTDTVKPLLAHKPADYYLESVDTFKFDVLATDNLGIDTVYLEYKINDGQSAFLGLKSRGNLLYSNSLSAKALSFIGGDSLKYRIIAFDKAATPNMKTQPALGFFTVKIEDIGPVVESFSTDFSDASDHFFNIGFNLTKPSGFTSYGLHSKHPYESPEIDGDSIVYIAMLRNPVKFDANGMIISYKDLSLVEPGEPGSVFGSSDFYDYVVLEGSTDFGKTWFSLADGYDCRYQNSWETLYNSSVSGQNSTATGNESLLVQHTLFPSTGSHISAGDTLMLRFRLFSDPYAYGWGWVVEDLHIGPLINSVKKTNDIPVIVYPNPGRGLFTIRGTVLESNKPLRYSIFNTAGTLVRSGYTGSEAENTIDITDQPSGIYFIQLFTSDGMKTFKYSLIR